RVDSGESPEDAVVRECEEEIGLVPHDLQRIRGLYPAPGFCDEELIFFRVTDLSPPPPDSTRQPDEDEYITAKPYDLAEARAMVENGQIAVLKTAYALTLLQPLYSRRCRLTDRAVWFFRRFQDIRRCRLQRERQNLVNS